MRTADFWFGLLAHAELERNAIEREAKLRVRLGDDVPFDLAVSRNAPCPRRALDSRYRANNYG
jgi:hypothetical protein